MKATIGQRARSADLRRTERCRPEALVQQGPKDLRDIEARASKNHEAGSNGNPNLALPRYRIALPPSATFRRSRLRDTFLALRSTLAEASVVALPSQILIAHHSRKMLAGGTRPKVPPHIPSCRLGEDARAVRTLLCAR